MTNETPDSIQQWTIKRRVGLVVNILKGDTSMAEAACRHGRTEGEVEDWRDRFLLGAENALLARLQDEEALKEASSNRRSWIWSSTMTSYGRR
jgi:hypothetical protein